MSQPGSRSASGSQSGSRSSSRSSSNSMKLPEPNAPQQQSEEGAAPPQAYPYAQAPAAAAAAEPVRDVPSVFIGLGPQGRNVTSDELADLLKSKATNPEHIHSVRVRGRCAFADTTTVEEAHHLIAQLNETMYKESIRLTVDISRKTLAESLEKRRERRPVEDDLANGGSQVFVSLGPKGDEVSTEEVRARIEAICPVLKLERRGFCIFADVSSPEETQKVVAAMNDTEINGARLIVKAAEVRRKRGRDDVEGRRGRGGRSPRRGDDRRDGRGARGERGGSRRSRSRSREVGRRHRRHRRSYSPSSRSSSSVYSRGRRSYSSGSVDSRGPRRRHRGGRGRRGGGGGAVAPAGGPRREGEHRRGGRSPRRDERRRGRSPRRDERRRGDEERRDAPHRDAPRDAPRERDERRDGRRGGEERRGERRDRH